MTKVLCDIYKCKKKPDSYLYVQQSEGFKRVPEELLQQFPSPEKFMTLVLTPAKKLARVDIVKVLQQLNERGYYLQLPPSPYGYMQNE